MGPPWPNRKVESLLPRDSWGPPDSADRIPGSNLSGSLSHTLDLVLHLSAYVYVNVRTRSIWRLEQK